MSQHEISLEHKEILVIEDNPSTIKFVSIVLSGKGAKVSKAKSGKEALENLCCHPQGIRSPDAILLDIYMDDMDGIIVYKHIKECKSCNSIPIILFSSDHAKLDGIYKLHLEEEELLYMPFTPDDLLKIIAKVINQKTSKVMNHETTVSETSKLTFTK